MSTAGYSDRINHALAFAAKHHDRQVHKGTRQPYGTHAANIGIILARYDRDDETVIAGILKDVVADCVNERYSQEMLDQRIGQKFGGDVLESILSVTLHRADADGVDFSHDERREDLLERLDSASERARWILAADALHAVGANLANLRRTIDPDSVWSQMPMGKEGTARWYRAMCERFRAIGFDAEIVDELARAVDELSLRASA
jgi:(p)ppGpp synthase/HD superfamily hydrolase